MGVPFCKGAVLFCKLGTQQNPNLENYSYVCCTTRELEYDPERFLDPPEDATRIGTLPETHSQASLTKDPFCFLKDLNPTCNRAQGLGFRGLGFRVPGSV